MPSQKPTFQVEDAQLIYKNFSGVETMYKPEGTHTFCTVLPSDMAEVLAADGWNVKCQDTEEAGPRTCHIEVTVGFKQRPPRIVMITEQSQTVTALTKETMGTLDWADIVKADLIVEASDWEYAGKTGRKAYLRSLYVTVREDELEKKYAALLNPQKPEAKVDLTDPEADND